MVTPVQRRAPALRRQRRARRPRLGVAVAVVLAVVLAVVVLAVVLAVVLGVWQSSRTWPAPPART
jgi:hypothetical protein